MMMMMMMMMMMIIIITIIMSESLLQLFFLRYNSIRNKLTSSPAKCDTRKVYNMHSAGTHVLLLVLLF